MPEGIAPTEDAVSRRFPGRPGAGKASRRPRASFRNGFSAAIRRLTTASYPRRSGGPTSTRKSDTGPRPGNWSV